MSKKLLRICLLTAVAASVLMITACPKQETKIEPGWSQKEGAKITLTHTITWDPSGSDLIGFDANQALLSLSLSGATISSPTGTATVSVKDLTNGQIVGQQNFAHVVRGTSLYAQDPTAVHNWLQQFTQYPSIDVIVVAATDVNTTGSNPSCFSSAQYLGVIYAASSMSWDPPAQPCPERGGCISQPPPGDN
ncbi:MAG: hypothetical protein ROO76_12625 [Terriglobia bacterium]|nr:hypothetical protein [Terriglobia bacterium]